MTQTAPDNALGRIAQGDAPVLETLLQMNLDAAERSGLDADTYLAVRLAALVAMDAAPPPRVWCDLSKEPVSRSRSAQDLSAAWSPRVA